MRGVERKSSMGFQPMPSTGETNGKERTWIAQNPEVFPAESIGRMPMPHLASTSSDFREFSVFRRPSSFLHGHSAPY